MPERPNVPYVAPPGLVRFDGPAIAADRVLTGDQLRGARAWTWLRAPDLRPLDCAGRVTIVVGQLLADPDGWIDTGDLLSALAEPDTVECALTLLADAGLPCDA